MVNDIICQREPDGISKSYHERRIAEHRAVIEQTLPIGAVKDYETLALLDKTTLYRLLALIESPKSRKWITYTVKIMNRLFKTK